MNIVTTHDVYHEDALEEQREAPLGLSIAEEPVIYPIRKYQPEKHGRHPAAQLPPVMLQECHFGLVHRRYCHGMSEVSPTLTGSWRRTGGNVSDAFVAAGETRRYEATPILAKILAMII